MGGLAKAVGGSSLTTSNDTMTMGFTCRTWGIGHHGEILAASFLIKKWELLINGLLFFPFFSGNACQPMNLDQTYHLSSSYFGHLPHSINWNTHKRHNGHKFSGLTSYLLLRKYKKYVVRTMLWSTTALPIHFFDTIIISKYFSIWIW